MLNTGKLAGQTLFITGASRGIGKAIALKAAKDGANIVIAAKTAEPHPKLPGTIYSAAKEVEAAGGKCLPCIVDVRDENTVQAAVESAVNKFGNIDILINNASAISLTGTVHTDMKRYDLMHSINTRGTFLVSKLCIPYLKKSQNPHILNISPPLNMNPIWFKNHVAYTMAKYGMSMCVLGMSEELKDEGIAVNALWPKTAISTAAMEMLGGKDIISQTRTPQIVADAAYAVLIRDAKAYTGNFVIDENVLKEAGVTDLDQYAESPGTSLMPDFFLDMDENEYLEAKAKIKGGQSSSGEGGNPVAEKFMKLKNMLSSELVSKTQAVYQFEIGGTHPGKWVLDLKNGTGAVSEGEHPSKADVLVVADSDMILSIMSGKQSPTSAFMSGKLKVKGDMVKAMQLDKLFKKGQAKL